jgi:hypothetical protein
LIAANAIVATRASSELIRRSICFTSPRGLQRRGVPARLTPQTEPAGLPAVKRSRPQRSH